MVNDLAPTPRRAGRTRGGCSGRTKTAAATLNLLRAVATGGWAALRRVHAGTRTSSALPGRAAVRAVALEIAGRWIHAGLRRARRGADGVELYCSHEALILEYERALTRPGSGAGAYDLSGHFVWVGERTRELGGAHIDFVSRIAQPDRHEGRPVGSPDEALELVERLDPAARPAG